jgi:serine-type D-Ala-D-Ala carboxypeptidase (penicillin-binding protein 5/6)
LAAALLGWTPTPALAKGTSGSGPTTRPQAIPPAKAEILVDVNTGRVLAGQNEHQLLPPASLTKMLIALIAIDWLRPATLVPGTTSAAKVYPYRLGMEPGQRWPLSEVLPALLIYSANDAAYALAERIGGSLEGFEPIMQEAAAQLGLTDGPVLHDPAGLDGTEGVGGGNRLSAWDLAVVARDLLANPTLASIVASKAFRATGPNGIVYDLASWNLGFLDSYPGAIGVKTGFTDPAGSCIAAAARRGSRTMLAVVMDGTSTNETAELLLNRGFATPVTAESGDVMLPSVREPEPPPPATSAHFPSVARKPVTLPRAVALPVTAAPSHSSAGLLDRRDDFGLIALAAGVIVGAVAATRTRHRWRRRPPRRTAAHRITTPPRRQAAVLMASSDPDPDELTS